MDEQTKLKRFQEELEALTKKYNIGIVPVLVVEQPSYYFSNIKAVIQFVPNKERNEVKEVEE